MLYEAALPLSPVLLIWAGGKLIPAKKQTILQLIQDGQLFFFCTALIAILLRDLGHLRHPAGDALIAFLYIILVVYCMLFGIVSMNKDQVDQKALGNLSLWSTVLVLFLVLGVRVSEGLL